MTPRVNVISLNSAGSSPRTRRSSAVWGANTGGLGSAMTSRTMSTQITGYGATHHTTLDGLGLGNPERRHTADEALASPRRISTSHFHPHSRASHSPGGSLHHLTHEAYYSHSQPPTASAPRFRGEMRHAHSHSEQYTRTFLPAASSSTTSGHQRQRSGASAINLPLVPWTSPPLSTLRRLRKSASNLGFHLGGQTEYDADNDAGVQDRGDGEDGKEQEMKVNGTRVWYRCDANDAISY